MARVRQFAAALVAAILALVAAVVGVLALTVWKPADQVVASTTPDRPYVMTRDKVLPLLAKDVTVTVTAPGDEEVSLVLGTTGDVLGWIGDSPYTEVVGVESGMETLKTVDHPGSGEAAQSGDDAQSGEDDQSGEDAQSGEEAQSGATPAGNDMWLQEATGRGSTSLTLTDVGTGRSVLAAVDGSADAPTLTLTWAVHQTNATAVVAFAVAALLAVIAVLFLVSELRILRHRRRRALKLAERAGADAADTQVIPLDQVRALAEQDGGTAAPADAEDAPAPAGAPAPDSTSAEGSVPTEEPGSAEESGESRDSGSATGDTSDAREGGDVAGDPEAGTRDPGQAEVERKPLLGRHGDVDAPLDVDPPVRTSGDSGIIDVSAIRAGVAFPSRRLLREAREKGEHTVVVDGHEFDTGLIPRVTRTTPSEEGGTEDTAPDTTDTSTEHEGSWSSLVSGWIHSGKGHDDETHS
ncbi:hypothetical protein [Actinomyces sp.]|uniref:hypothetical protein n=1 Tax=Actinomyces sp. TaxID=29317 RepID=UPI0028A2A4B2|nr:hypothetical protein [Actinomyces sp.]